jgi:hypothetical protein
MVCSKGKSYLKGKFYFILFYSRMVCMKGKFYLRGSFIYLIHEWSAFRGTILHYIRNNWRWLDYDYWGIGFRVW